MNALSDVMQRFMFGLAFAIALASTVPGEAAARFFPLEALQPGTKGTGKTVMRGTEIESFEVEYIGIMRDAGPSGDLILVRVSGAAIDRSGGIAAGMSGSPVYIDDQLVGAIGYGFNMADHRVGLVTPIDDMLAVFDLMADDGARPLPADATDADEPKGEGGVARTGPEGHTTRAVVPIGVILASSAEEAAALAETAPADTLVFAPARTPILAAGFSPRALEDLSRRLQPFNLVPVQAGAPPLGAPAVDTLQPGSAFGVQLARGDISLTSLGTVTHVDGDRFIGFGHPFTNRGNVEFITSSAFVHDVVQAASIPFKLGAPLQPVGSLLQDRGAAVGGRLGPGPGMIPVTVSVHDVDRDQTSLRQFEIVRDNDYTVQLATSGALALLDRSLDRLGRGTARVVFRVEGEGLSRPLLRDNVYYSDFDIAALSLLEFMEAISLVVNNRFEPVDITRIHLSAQIEQRRRTAHVENAVPDKTEVSPGDTVRIEVTLRPYREEPVVEVIELNIPADAGRGGITVEVRGGGWGLRPPVADEDTILDDPEEALGETVSDLTRLVEQFTRRERNNELVAEFYGPRRRSRGGDDVDVGSDDAAWQQTFPGGGWVAVAKATDYVLLGTHHFDLSIISTNDDGIEDEGVHVSEALAESMEGVHEDY